MHILVVDDDPLAGEMIGAIVEEAGHRVTRCENGVEAMEQIAAAGAGGDGAGRVDLVLSDMNMPLVSGLELFRTLREQGDATPFILLTGDAPEALRAEEPRLDGCMTKDFDMADQLLAAIEAVGAP